MGILLANDIDNYGGGVGLEENEMKWRMKLTADYARNSFFGIEDGLVSTAGVMFGVATATTDRAFVLTVGMVTVLVEATSMGIGAYLSEKSANEVEKRVTVKPVVDGILMFLTYSLAGTYCVSPYGIFGTRVGMYVSVLMTLGALFLLGYLPRKSTRRGLEVFMLGGLAVLIGYFAGGILSKLVF